uniref:Solute carrier family 25 member 46 n=1 Tax=Haemonchus contortus TaxID=6289 RepID=A0A7I4XW89_HAECO
CGMPFIQNRNFLQSKSQEGRMDPVDDLRDERYYPTSSRGPETSNAPRYAATTTPPITSVATDDPLAGALLGLADVTTKLAIAHPCMVLRRQCQVHQNARYLHLTPFTLVPVVCNMVSNEGILTFWKGSIGSCVVWGLSNMTEIVLADLLGLPRHVVPNGSTEKYWRHILLKASTFFAMTPFFISAFTETVRSEAGLGGEGPNVMEVLLKGVDRLRFPIFGSRDPSRRFSVLHLAVPTVIYRTSHYIIQTKLHYQFFRMARKYVNKKPESERTKFHQYVPQLFAQMSSTILTDLILFPIETIMHRMYIQGTRTLIDNLDTGLSAISINAKYSGFADCLRSVLQHEGFWALYGGVGALALEYLLHSLLHQIVRACFDRGSEVLRRAVESNPNITPVPTPYGGAFASSLRSSTGPLSGPFTQPVSPVISPIKQFPSYTPPLRDPTQFPTFGESISQLDSPFAAPTPPFPFQTGRPNAFGSPPRTIDRPSSAGYMSPLSLVTDRPDDPYNG